MEELNFILDLRILVFFKELGLILECDVLLDFLFLLLNGLIFVFILLGNGLVCFIFLKIVYFRCCFMNRFFVSLGFFDIFMVLLILLGYVIFCMSFCSQFISKYCWLISLIRYFVFLVIKFNFFVILYDRYIVVMQFLKYKVKINFKRVLIIFIIVWIIFVILILSCLVWWIKLFIV